MFLITLVENPKLMIMKSLKITLKISLLCVLLMYACTKQGGDQEPNNTITEASPVTLGEEFGLTIDPLGDVDWFKVSVKKQGYIRVQSANKVDGVQLEVSFAKYQEWEEQKEKKLRGWRPVPDALFVSEPGDYYLVLKDEWDDGTSKEEFMVRIDILDEFDATEPNNSVEEAHRLTLEEQFSAGIYPVGDMDCFEINVPAQGYLEIVAKNIPEEVQPEVRFVIYDEWSDPQLKEIRGWGKIPQACFVSDSGKYYIIMHDSWDDHAIAQAFDLKVSFIPEFDLFEPNNTLTNAHQIEPGEAKDIAIFPKGDLDYFKFVAPQPQVKVSAKDFEGIQPEIKILSVDPENPTQAVAVKEWVKLPATLELEPGKEYLMVVHDAWDDHASQKTFQLKVD
jgi:hypothetical protein